MGSRACCCDLDFKTETVPGADSQRALFLARPGRATAGPFCLVAPGCATEHAYDCLFLAGVMVALLSGSLSVCVTVPAAKGGLFILVQVGGWEWGLLGPHLLFCDHQANLSSPAVEQEGRKMGVCHPGPFDLPHSQPNAGVICGQTQSGTRSSCCLPTPWSSSIQCVYDTIYFLKHALLF